MEPSRWWENHRKSVDFGKSRENQCMVYGSELIGEYQRHFELKCRWKSLRFVKGYEPNAFFGVAVVPWKGRSRCRP